jgi:NAD(P)-dependent dehydrogenase (short-subunit alcohol dehydrogenase family)
MFELKNKIALVTGGRRGMGRTHALALARQGAKVVVTDIDARVVAGLSFKIIIMKNFANLFLIAVFFLASLQFR